MLCPCESGTLFDVGNIRNHKPAGVESQTFASLLAPVAPGTVVDWASAPGIVLACTALAATVGPLGLYRRANARSPALAMAGAVGAGVACLGSPGLFGMIGVAAAMAVDGTPPSSAPVELFKLLAISVAAGLSAGFLSSGNSVRRADGPLRTAGTLMIGGGALLLSTIAWELLHSLVGVAAVM